MLLSCVYLLILFTSSLLSATFALPLYAFVIISSTAAAAVLVAIVSTASAGLKLYMLLSSCKLCEVLLFIDFTLLMRSFQRCTLTYVLAALMVNALRTRSRWAIPVKRHFCRSSCAAGYAYTPHLTGNSNVQWTQRTWQYCEMVKWGMSDVSVRDRWHGRKKRQCWKTTCARSTTTGELNVILVKTTWAHWSG